MANFGGSTYFGGGAVFGGGPSKEEAWRSTLIEWLGRNVFDTSDGTGIWNLMAVEGGQFAGAQVDGDRIFSEGLAPLAVETLEEWERICFVERILDSEDARRDVLLSYWSGMGGYTSLARAIARGRAILVSAANGLSTIIYGWQCSHAQALAVLDNGQGVRYWALLMPAWTWDDRWRRYHAQVLAWCERQDPAQCEASCPITNDGGSPPEPAFYFSESLFDRDCVRD